jgi:serine/threonine protein phosphatase 1
MRSPFDRRSKEQPPRPSPGEVIYAVGDIHGCSHLLAEVFKKIDADVAARRIERATEVFIGDYIDRGPDSYGVIEALSQRRRSRASVLLGGNHEAMLGQFLAKPATLPVFLQLGGLTTLLSYGVKPTGRLDERAGERLAAEFRAALPTNHREVLANLRYSFTSGDYFFVHAGVRPKVPLAKQAVRDFLWIRDDFLLWEESFEKFVVHGHTPVPQPDLQFNRANIDTGAFATGRLTVLAIDEDGHRPL